MAFIEMSPGDANQLGVSGGEVVEVFNDFGSA